MSNETHDDPQDPGEAGQRRLVSLATDLLPATGHFSSTGSIADGDTAGVVASVVLPGHTVLGEIAHGGMGVVLRVRDDRFERPLAVKVLLGGSRDPAAAMTRFLAEARITAQLQHPGVPPVHEMGRLADGRPYFSMKLIEGRTLAELLRERPSPQVDLPRFLGIFEQIAQTLAYAHAQGVIHRDLKPLNVMVGAFGEVQLMDWGLAKRLPATVKETWHSLPSRAESEFAPSDADSTLDGTWHRLPACAGKFTPSDADSTLDASTTGDVGQPFQADSQAGKPDLHVTGAAGPSKESTVSAFGETPDARTHDGAVMGTIAYMSPEQARGEIHHVDFRSDVFGLGAILCEILTGVPPYVSDGGKKSWDRARNADLHDAMTRIGASSADAELIDLTSRCLSPQQDDRPAAAGIVAGHIRGYLTGLQERLEQARADRAAAEVKASEERKRRHISAALATSLLLGGIGLIFGLVIVSGKNSALAAVNVSLTKANVAEREATLDAQAKREEAETARREEAQARKRAEGATDYLVKSFRSPDPWREGRTILMAEVLDRAAKDLSSQFEDDPITKATLLIAIGESYRGLGLYRESVPLYEQALNLRQINLSENHTETLIAMNELAAAYDWTGRSAEAIPLFERAAQVFNSTVGPEHRDTLGTINNLANAYRNLGRDADALPLLEQTFALMKAKFGVEHPDTLHLMNNLAGTFMSAGRLTESVSLYEETLQLRRSKLGAEHPDTLMSMDNLAQAYQAAGRLSDALPMLESSLALREAKLGADHPHTLSSINNLASALLTAGRHAEALPHLEETLKRMQAKFGAEHPDSLTSLNNLAAAYGIAGRMADALPLLEETLRIRKSQLAKDHPDILSSMSNLASAYNRVGRLREALPLFEDVLRLRKAMLGADHPETLHSMHYLAGALEDAGRLSESLPLFEETLRLRKAKLGLDHPDTLTTMNNLAMAYESAGRVPEAIALFEETLRLRESKLGAEHHDTITSVNNLGMAYRNVGRFSEALPLLEKTVQWFRNQVQPGAEHAEMIDSMGNLASTYLLAKEYPRALSQFEEFVSLKRRTSPEDDPVFASLLSGVSAELLRHHQYPAAEVYLRESLAIRIRSTPNDWTRFNTQRILGAALMRQKKFAEAEPLLVQGYEGMKARADTIPEDFRKPGLIDALQWLVELYTAWAKPDEAAKWQKELDAARRKATE